MADTGGEIAVTTSTGHVVVDAKRLLAKPEVRDLIRKLNEKFEKRRETAVTTALERNGPAGDS